MGSCCSRLKYRLINLCFSLSNWVLFLGVCFRCYRKQHSDVCLIELDLNARFFFINIEQFPQIWQLYAVGVIFITNICACGLWRFQLGSHCAVCNKYFCHILTWSVRQVLIDEHMKRRNNGIYCKKYRVVPKPTPNIANLNALNCGS